MTNPRSRLSDWTDENATIIGAPAQSAAAPVEPGNSNHEPTASREADLFAPTDDGIGTGERLKERVTNDAGESLKRPLSMRFTMAVAYASELHCNQARKGTQIPYVAHLLAVAAIALEHGASEDEAIAALLHDAVEDQGGAAVALTIRERFGDTVADIVAACTDAVVIPKPDWRRRKEEHVEHMRGASRSVRLVSAADKLHNARAVVADYRKLGEALWGRFKGGRTGTLWYYRAMADAFAAAGGDDPLVIELERVVSELESVARVSAEPD